MRPATVEKVLCGFVACNNSNKHARHHRPARLSNLKISMKQGQPYYITKAEAQSDQCLCYFNTE